MDEPVDGDDPLHVPSQHIPPVPKFILPEHVQLDPQSHWPAGHAACANKTSEEYTSGSRKVFMMTFSFSTVTDLRDHSSLNSHKGLSQVLRTDARENDSSPEW